LDKKRPAKSLETSRVWLYSFLCLGLILPQTVCWGKSVCRRCRIGVRH